MPLLGKAWAGVEGWTRCRYATENPNGLVFPARCGGDRNHDHVLRWYIWKGSPSCRIAWCRKSTSTPA